MLKTFSYFLGNKKAAALIFLFLTLSGLIIPQVVSADWNPLCWQWVWGKPTPGSFKGDYCYYSAENNTKVLNTLNSAVKYTFLGVIAAVATILVSIFAALATLAAELFHTILGLATGIGGTQSSMCYTCMANPGIAAGWPMVRDLANMFVVLGFVVVGIATTLRLRDYEAKKLLPKLIIMALLINFSLTICGVLIDGSNIAMQNFTKSGGYLADSASQNIKNQANLIWDNFDPDKPSETLGSSVLPVFYDSILFIIFMLFSALFLFRFIALWILVILSPLAFVCYVFPFTKKYYDMWWNNFLGWCIIGIPAGLFIWISDKLAESFIKGTSATDASILGFLLPSFFLIAGFLVSMQTSAMGASAVIRGARWSGGKITGAVAGGAKGTLKGLGKATGATEAARNIGHGATRMGEKMGLVKGGTSAKWQKEQVSSDKKQYENMTSTQLAADVNRGALTTAGRKANDIKAQILAERGDLDKVGVKGAVGASAVADQKVREQVVARAIANDRTGDAITSFRKADPNYARFDSEKVAEKMRDNPKMTKGQAEKAVVADTVQKMAPREFAKNVHQSAYTPEVLGAMSSEQISAVFGPAGSVKKREALKKATHGKDIARMHASLDSNFVAQQELENNIHLIRNHEKNRKPQGPPVLPLRPNTQETTEQKKQRQDKEVDDLIPAGFKPIKPPPPPPGSPKKGPPPLPKSKRGKTP